MKIYIAGPMTGHDDYNYPAFNNAERHLLIQGHKVVNPAAIGAALMKMFAKRLKTSDFLREDFTHLIHCEAIYLLKGWEKSAGAKLEYEIAKALDMEVFYE